jgi:hypothetical protein
MHIGIMYFLLLMTNAGATERGKDNVPITFYIMESANYKLSPPF